MVGHPGRVGFLRRLDDRVIGRAERDPVTRRRADAWANGLLILIGAAIAIPLLISDRNNGVSSAGVFVLIGVVVAGGVVRIARSRGR